MILNYKATFLNKMKATNKRGECTTKKAAHFLYQLKNQYLERVKHLITKTNYQ